LLQSIAGISGIVILNAVIAKLILKNSLNKLETRYHKLHEEYNSLRDSFDDWAMKSEIEALFEHIKIRFGHEASKDISENLDKIEELLKANSLDKDISDISVIPETNRGDHFHVGLPISPELINAKLEAFIKEVKEKATAIYTKLANVVRGSPIKNLLFAISSPIIPQKRTPISIDKTSLWKNHQLNLTPPVIIAHRIESKEDVEQALKANAAAVEVDVQLTKDGMLVALWDKEVAGKKVYELTLSQLREIKGEILIIEELFELVKDKGIAIDLDIKDWSRNISKGISEDKYSKELLTKISDLIKKNNLENNIHFGSFNLDYVKKLKELNPEVIGRIAIPQDVKLTPEKLEEFIKFAKEVGASVIFRYPQQLNEDIIEIIHNNNLYVSTDFEGLNKEFRGKVDLIYRNLQRKESSVAIVIPTLNAEKAIGKVISEIPYKELEDKGYKTTVYIVDGLSTDKTIEVARKDGAEVILEKRWGKAIAIKTAFEQLKDRYDYFIMLDADATYPPKYIPQILEGLQRNDVVIGSRLKGIIEPGAMSNLHKISNKIITWTGNVLYGQRVSDICTGYWGFRKEVIQNLNIDSHGFALEANLFTQIQMVLK